MLLLSSTFFQNQLFQKILSGTLSVSHSLDPDQDWHFVGPDLVQTVCKHYKQTPKVAACKERVVIKQQVRKEKKPSFFKAEHETYIEDFFIEKRHTAISLLLIWEWFIYHNIFFHQFRKACIIYRISDWECLRRLMTQRVILFFSRADSSFMWFLNLLKSLMQNYPACKS